MTRTTLLGAACLLLVGLLVGYIAGSGGPSLREIDAAVSARIDAAAKAESDRTAALETKVADLGGRLDAVSAQVQSGTEAVQGLGDRLGGNLADVADRLGDSVNAAGATSVAALQSGLDKLEQSLAAIPSALAEKPGAATPGAAGAAVEPSGIPAGNAAGETVILSDAARIFISRVDDAAGEALLYVDGAPATLKLGETMPFHADGQDCELTLAALDRGHASITGACGSDLPAPTGTAAGQVAVLADGAVRVFVSGADPKGARIAINGVQTEQLAVGESVDVVAGEKACKVAVTGIDRGHVALDATCS